jgi:hypothetical protein
MNRGPVADRVSLGRKALLAKVAGPGAELQVDGIAVALQGEERLEAQRTAVAWLEARFRILVLQPR